MKNRYIIVCVFLFILIGFLLLLRPKNTKQLEVTFQTKSSVELENKLPISDTLGKKLTGSGSEEGIQGFIEFSVQNPNDSSIKYQILLRPIETELEPINSNYIKLYLTDQKDQPYDGFEKNKISTARELKALPDQPKYRLLYSGSISGKQKKTFRLRSWLSDTYVVHKKRDLYSYEIVVQEK